MSAHTPGPKRGRGFSAPHTPGPWKVIANLIYPSNFSTPSEGLTSIAKVSLPPRCRLATGKYAANAALIAAAPALLAACEAADDWFSPGNDSYERKAEECYRETGFMRPGKDQPAAASHSYDERSAAWNEWCAKRSAKVLADLRAAIAAAKGTR